MPEHDERCDHWIVESDRRCTRKWKVRVRLFKRIYITSRRSPRMWGGYGKGNWYFCTQHYNLFTKGRDDGSE